MRIMSSFLSLQLILSPLEERTVLWLGSLEPPSIENVNFLRGNLSKKTCELDEAKSLFERAKGNFEFFQLDDALQGFEKVKEMVKRYELCEEGRMLKAKSEFYMGACKLALGDYRSARMYVNYAVRWGMFMPLKEGEFPDPLTRLHKEVLTSVEWCEVKISGPLKDVSFRIDGIESEGKIPCGKHLITAYLGTVEIGAILAEVQEGAQIEVPLEITEESAEELIKKGVFSSAFIARELPSSSIYFKYILPSQKGEEEISPLRLREFVEELLYGKKKEKRISIEKELKGEMVFEEKESLLKNPYFWGGIGGGVLLTAGIVLAIIYGGGKEKRVEIIISW